MMSEEERIRELVRAIADGRDTGEELVIGGGGRWFATPGPYGKPDDQLQGETEDFDVYGTNHRMG